MAEITVKVYNRRYNGDTSYHIETHQIPTKCLAWWKEHSGKGDFILIHSTIWS